MNISNINLITFNDESKADSFYASYKCKMRNKKRIGMISMKFT